MNKANIELKREILKNLNQPLWRHPLEATIEDLKNSTRFSAGGYFSLPFKYCSGSICSLHFRDNKSTRLADMIWIIRVYIRLVTK